MVTSGLKKERGYMYIDAEGKESPELKGMPVREGKWESRREWQCKVSERRRGGGTHKNQENGV